VLSRSELTRRLLDHKSGFAITPIVDTDSQIAEASVDLRLGPDFIVAKRATGLSTFDPAQVDDIGERIRDYQDYMRRPVGSAFYLHPGQFALARTLEYLTLPREISAEVVGRSSWGRLGLVIATAPLIQPGFKGTVTLELSNLGTVPMVLYVGVRIAQATFYEVTR